MYCLYIWWIVWNCELQSWVRVLTFQLIGKSFSWYLLEKKFLFHAQSSVIDSFHVIVWTYPSFACSREEKVFFFCQGRVRTWFLSTICIDCFVMPIQRKMNMKVVYFEDCLTVGRIFLHLENIWSLFSCLLELLLVLTKCLRILLSLFICENMKEWIWRGIDANSVGNGEDIYLMPPPLVTGDAPIGLYIKS